MLALSLLAAGARWVVLNQLGYTPGEVITYLERRLRGHPKLEVVAHPVLNWLRRQVDADLRPEQAMPFVVPPLTPNPLKPDGERQGYRDPAIIRVGPGRPIQRIADAVKLAVDGSVIEVDPGDYVADVAVLNLPRLTIRGRGRDVRLIAMGASAEGKAIWVVRRGTVVVEGIDFIGAKVHDQNGAGIRLESGHLTVRRCRFLGNQTGILTTGDPNAVLEVEGSEFGYNGAGDGLSHGLYVGPIRRFRLTGSYVHHANGGHLVKSRARENRVEYNRLTDETGGRAAYELEFPNGGVAEVVGNVVQQGSNTRNSAIVAYGLEGLRWPDNRLSLVHNTLVNDHPWGGQFLRLSPVPVPVVSRNNLLVGHGKWPPVADAGGDRRLDWRFFARPARQDYRPSLAAWGGLGDPVPVPVAPGLVPQWEYSHTAQWRRLAAAPVFPGAVQTPSP